MNETTSLENTVRIIQRDFASKEYKIFFITSEKAKYDSKMVMRKLSEESSRISIFIQTVNGGAGLALSEFRRKVNSDYIFMLAADGETPAEYCIEMYNLLIRQNVDIVQASRWLRNNDMQEYNVIKRALNWAFQTYLRLLYRRQITDWTFGLRLYNLKAYTIGDWNEKGHAVYLESLLIPILSGCTLIELPVRWKRRLEGGSNLMRLKLLEYVFVSIKLRFQYK
jgi:hypothetical protein